MASGRDYLEFILEQLSGLDGIRYRYMMGEYVLYYRGKVSERASGSNVRGTSGSQEEIVLRDIRRHRSDFSYRGK